MTLVVDIVHHNINPFTGCFNLRHKLVLIPLLPWEVDQRLCLWNPIRAIHVTHWDMVVMCEHIDVSVDQDSLACILWHGLHYFRANSGSEVESRVRINYVLRAGLVLHMC